MLKKIHMLKKLIRDKINLENKSQNTQPKFYSHNLQQLTHSTKIK